MRPFAYFRAETPAEACRLLREKGPAAKPLAGGTDLLVKAKRGLVPETVVDLSGLAELRYIHREDGWIKIGALTPLGEVSSSALLQEKAGLLSGAAGKVGSRQIRNMATLGGNLCNAAPSADTAAPLLALEARAKILGVDGTREVPLGEFFRGPGQTCLEPGEILVEVSFPEPDSGWRGIYLKQTRRQAMDIALVGVALALQVDEGGVISSARLALSAVGPTPFRAKAAEEALEGLALTGDLRQAEHLFQQVAGLVREVVRPITDVRASAGYRRHLVSVLVRRALRDMLPGFPPAA